MDLPRKTLIRRADEVLVLLGDIAEVHFKFTCEKCGKRNTLSEPDTLNESGECSRCGHVSKITKGGFMLQMTVGDTDK